MSADRQSTSQLAIHHFIVSQLLQRALTICEQVPSSCAAADGSH